MTRQRQIAWAIGAIAFIISMLLGITFTASSDNTTALSPQTINPHLATICTAHSRMQKTYPAQDPKTFFESLGLDYTSHPFSSKQWLVPGEVEHDEAIDLITRSWAQRVQRSLESEHGETGLYSQIAQAMQSHQIMAVYMSALMPRLAKAGGKQRRAILDKLCLEMKGE
ncbi:hypothetical protein HG530_014542 [Fusarium avenaceum]|nr:hypothetical protein DER45DRAFT_623919 [Fusarium avenaceum]KAI6750646.1 hypothetical protein HG530_014542 [Fusarium avenaceum]